MEKEYHPIDLSANTRYASFDEHLNATCTPEEIAEIKKINARMSCAHALTAMRIKSGISQVVMADELHTGQSRISVLESSPNEKISMATILKYVEATGISFEAELEDGKIIKVLVPKKKKYARTPSIVS